jgi:ABC-type Fe3+-hydroxamate transport system substrate-binding protein
MVNQIGTYSAQVINTIVVASLFPPSENMEQIYSLNPSLIVLLSYTGTKEMPHYYVIYWY